MYFYNNLLKYLIIIPNNYLTLIYSDKYLASDKYQQKLTNGLCSRVLKALN